MGVEVRSQRNQPGPAASRCKQEIEAAESKAEETGKQKGRGSDWL